MLEEPLESPGETSPEELLARYESALADVVSDEGVDAVVGATDLDAGTVESVASGEAADIDLRDAAAILAVCEGSAEASTILSEVRDHLLLSMSSAMLDVDRIAADLEGDVDAREVQGKVEGRHPMTLAEYARLHHYVANAA
jgi:hypothetical protein